MGNLIALGFEPGTSLPKAIAQVVRRCAIAQVVRRLLLVREGWGSNEDISIVLSEYNEDLIFDSFLNHAS